MNASSSAPACLNQYFCLEFPLPQWVAVGAFQESIGYSSKTPGAKENQVDSHQAMTRVHLLISRSFREGHAVSLGPLVFKNILHHGDVAKQEEAVPWVL